MHSMLAEKPLDNYDAFTSVWPRGDDIDNGSLKYGDWRCMPPLNGWPFAKTAND